MDFMRAIQYPFEDEDWVTKVGVGIVIMLVPILNITATGYMVEVIRNVANNDPRPMPNWDRLGDFFMKGLFVVLAQIVYSIVPYAILVAVLVPLYILPLLGGQSEEATMMLSGLTLVGVICVSLIGFVLLIAASLLLMAGLIRFSVGRQEIGELFQVADNFKFLRDHLGLFLMAVVYIFVLLLVIGTLIGCIGLLLGLIPICGQIITFIIALPLGFLITLFLGHLCGQIARQAGLTGPQPSTPPMV